MCLKVALSIYIAGEKLFAREEKFKFSQCLPISYQGGFDPYKDVRGKKAGELIRRGGW